MREIALSTRECGMRSFAGRLGVVTGGGSGMGAELVVQLAAQGCSVATCDIRPEALEDTVRRAAKDAPDGTTVTAHSCDVADEASVERFRDEVLAQHGRDHVNLLFNNAGIGGGGSFLLAKRDEWDRTFAIDWGGVYNCSRAFVPLLVASDDGYLVNTSSVNGFWASLGPGVPHTAYSAAKFAVKGFSEALVTDLRVHAPHVKVAVVMPGHIGTSIVINTAKVLGKPDALHMEARDVVSVRALLQARGLPVESMSDDDIRTAVHHLSLAFRDNAPVSAAQAATVILEGVRTDKWRILVGDDAHALDRMVRESPENAYEQSFVDALHAQGFLQLFD
jgi:NAD(P)-dependent dehydrogenase (short-subunit alcohol dehydrogenase family)